MTFFNMLPLRQRKYNIKHVQRLTTYDSLSNMKSTGMFIILKTMIKTIMHFKTTAYVGRVIFCVSYHILVHYPKINKNKILM
jgi:hypothetical protein